MTATNHVITGALIASVIHNPVVALPAALLSHFVLDALPHFGGVKHTAAGFLRLLFCDMFIACLFLGWLVLYRPDHWFLLGIGGVLAASPDLMWLPAFLLELRTGKQPSKLTNPITRFHTFVQWGERPWGIAIEIVWFAAMLTLFAANLS